MDTDGKKLVLSENKEIETILPKKRKIKHVELIVNWFGSHRILSRILTAAAEYAAASLCRYIETDATVTVVGPKQLANRYFVDEVMIARARQRIFIQKVEKKAEAVVLGSTEKFDKKMKDLREMVHGQKDAIDSLQTQLQFVRNADSRHKLGGDRAVSWGMPGGLGEGREACGSQVRPSRAWLRCYRRAGPNRCWSPHGLHRRPSTTWNTERR